MGCLFEGRESLNAGVLSGALLFVSDQVSTAHASCMLGGGERGLKAPWEGLFCTELTLAVHFHLKGSLVICT